MQYKLTQNGVLRTNSDSSQSSIPDCDSNSDWQRYQAWLAEDPENNIPLPADEE